MTNSDKRRYVADAIRFYAHDGDESVYAFMRGYSPCELADLIDPTCHIAYDDWASQQCMGPMLSCDRCGNAFPEINGPYQYCPCCGARVVSDYD